MKCSFQILLLSLMSALAFSAPPDATESEYLVTASGMFSFVEGGNAYYALNYDIIKPLPDAAHLKFVFQNPANKSDAITDTRKLELNDKTILVQSVPLSCIGNKKTYTVTIEIYADESESELISVHEQKLEFRVPKKLASQMGIKLC